MNQSITRYVMNSLIQIVFVVSLTVTHVYAGADYPHGTEGPSKQAPGSVLPARAEPRGYSLTDLAKATAAFNVTDHSGAPPFPIPDLVDGAPFQELYTTPTNQFDVKRGTLLYVPVTQITDSPPVAGNFPVIVKNRKSVLRYVFSHKEIGLEYARITIDGKVFSLDERNVSGVRVGAPLPDGGGTGYINVAAFVELNKKGLHTVEISARLAGLAALKANGNTPIEFSVAYVVTVK